MPLSFDRDGEALLLATPSGSPTGRNLAATGAVRLALGLTRDVLMIEGDVEVLEMDGLRPERGDRFAARSGFAHARWLGSTADPASSRGGSRRGGRWRGSPSGT